jgi:phage/plasmid-like protein (TIGR03299 family)
MPAGIESKDSMMSVREMPWHRLGVVLDDYPTDIDDALSRSGLGWRGTQGDVFVVNTNAPDNATVDGVPHPLVLAEGFKANIREDTGDVLGVVSDDYKIVQNRDAFRWLDALLGGDVQFETAGSLGNGKRVWVLARIPELVEVGGDEVARYIYCANSHDGSMAVTAAATNIRIVCANTLGWALRETEGSQRTYKFRHTGDLQLKLDEARRVMEIVLDWDAAFKRMGDELARQKMSAERFDKKVITPLLGLDDPRLQDRKIALQNRQDSREVMLDTFNGHGPEGDTSGNSPGTKWSAANVIAEHADWNRRVTAKTDQMRRSFEDQDLKQRGLELVIDA